MRYTLQGKQLSIEAFRSLLDTFSKSNRWVQLGDNLPWGEIEYNSKLNNRCTGAANKPARMVVGELIIKHKPNLSDVETIAAIGEKGYSFKIVFRVH